MKPEALAEWIHENAVSAGAQLLAFHLLTCCACLTDYMERPAAQPPAPPALAFTLSRLADDLGFGRGHGWRKAKEVVRELEAAGFADVDWPGRNGSPGLLRIAMWEQFLHMPYAGRDPSSDVVYARRAPRSDVAYARRDGARTSYTRAEHPARTSYTRAETGRKRALPAETPTHRCKEEVDEVDGASPPPDERERRLQRLAPRHDRGAA